MVPVALITAVGVQIACQLFKFVFYSARDGRVSPRYLVTAGGVPSAHAAFVTALSVAIGMRSGFGSDLFAVSGVFSAIVIYDAYRLRGHVQHHAILINRYLLSRSDEEPLSEMVGHSLPELVVGMLVGGAAAAAVTLLTAG